MARTLGKVLVAIALLMAVLGLLSYVFRDPLATKVAAFALDRRSGRRCTHPDLRIDGSLELVTISPIDCSIAKGPIARFSTQSDMEVQMNGFKPGTARVAQAIMDQRERDVSHVESNTLADLADLVGFRDQLVKGMLDAAESFSSDGPVLRVATLVAKRGGKREAVMRDFERSFDNGWVSQRAERVEAGPKVAEIRNFDMRVTPSRGVLTLEIFLGKPEPGDEPDIKLKLEGSRLNEKKPHFELSM